MVCVCVRACVDECVCGMCACVCVHVHWPCLFLLLPQRRVRRLLSEKVERESLISAVTDHYQVQVC